MANSSKSKKKAYGSSSGRPQPLTAKASFTRNRSRRYGCGGKIKR
jgi:hypothetical protein